jgi:CheY-like chemotaxis protein
MFSTLKAPTAYPSFCASDNNCLDVTNAIVLLSLPSDICILYFRAFSFYDKSAAQFWQHIFLAKEGYGVSRAYSGTEALLVLSRSNPDLILLDLMLPGLNGKAVLPRIQGIPVIVVSAKAGIDSKVDLLLGGAVDSSAAPCSSVF